MHILYSLITVFLVKTVNSQNDPGDELGLNLNTDEQNIDFFDPGPTLAPPVVLENPAAGQSYMSETTNPEISLPDLGVATDSGAPDLSGESSLDNTITSQSDSSILDHGYQVAADEDCSLGDFREKLEDPELQPKPVVKTPVKPAKAPPEEGHGEPKNPDLRFCPRNPPITTRRGERRNCAFSKNTYCSPGPYESPYLKDCIDFDVDEANDDGKCSLDKIWCCTSRVWNRLFNIGPEYGVCTYCKLLFEERPAIPPFENAEAITGGANALADPLT